MSQRRILVIGSQCKALGHLAFLPQAAQDLYVVMTDPERGACVSAIEGPGLLIDPTVKVTKDSIGLYQVGVPSRCEGRSHTVHRLHRPWCEVGL